MEEKEDEERGGVMGSEEIHNYPAWRLVLRRLVDHHKFQVTLSYLSVTWLYIVMYT